MMGRQARGQERLFYTFHLDDHVPANHLLRRINRCIDFSGLHQHLARDHLASAHVVRNPRALTDRVRLSLELSTRLLERSGPPIPLTKRASLARHRRRASRRLSAEAKVTDWYRAAWMSALSRTRPSGGEKVAPQVAIASACLPIIDVMDEGLVPP